MKPVKSYTYALIALASGLPASAAADVGSVEAPFRFYSIADGLTQSEVLDIEQDRAGYLWFTTSRGLNRFNGREFDNYTIADGMQSNALTVLDVADDNSVWVGDEEGGLTILRGGRVAETVPPVTEQNAAIVDIEVIDGEAVAIIEGVGIARVVGTPGSLALKVVTGEWAGPRSLHQSNGKAWLVADGGLYSLALLPTPRIRLIDPGIALLHAGTDSVWALNGRNEIGRIVNSRFERAAELPADFGVTSLAADPAGSVWVSSNNELLKINPRYDGAAVVRRYEGFEEIESLYVDNEHTLWLSSSSRLARFLGERFQHYKLQTAAEPATIWAIAQDSEGRFWFATQSHVMRRNADESITILDESHGLPQSPVRDLVSDSQGVFWAGVADHGLYRIDASTLRAERIPGTEGVTVFDVGVAADGAIWAGTDGDGMFRYDPRDRSLRIFPTPDDAPVYTFDISDDGSIWYGADEVGLVHLDVGSDGTATQSIFGSDAGFEHELFNHIYLIGPGAAWIAAEEGGLYRFEDGHFERFGLEQPFADQTLYVVEPLGNGSLVLGGEQGLYHYVPDEGRSVYYNQMTGFLGLENNVHATLTDSDGWLWIGTVDGASRMNTQLDMPPIISLTPQILSIKNALTDENILEGGELENGNHGINIEFAAVSLTDPRNVEMSYSMQGINDSWTNPTTNMSVKYSRLPPGTHRFMVRARYPGSEWSDAVAAHTFTVRPLLWQRPSFLLGLVVLVIAAIRAAFVYRTRNIARINQMLKEQVSERTRSIEAARRELEASNEQLSLEVEERRKAELAREELETRFRKAFENAPIGMGLLDADAMLFDANPALLLMLWSMSHATEKRPFAEVIAKDHRERFATSYKNLMAGAVETLDEQFECVDATGNSLITELSVSPIHSDEGEFLYSVIQVQDLTESQRLTDKLEYQARYDELTGLLNRRAFEAELDKAWEICREDGEQSYLLYMDLDQFKVVNDTSGHAAGDKLLQGLAELLLAQVRSNDSVGRLGGDEFAIILWKCPSNVAERIAESIRESVHSFRFQWDTETYKVGVSIGCVPLDPSLGDVSEIQQLADSACFAAKEEGRNRVHMLEGEKDLARVHRRQIRWVQRLREAMDNNRFAMFAQRIAPLKEQDCGLPRYEILLRLRDPETRRMIPPGAFLPAAERYGLSVELDEWVIRNLIRSVYLHQSFAAEPCRYWINLSGISVGEKRFAAFLKQVIEKSPLPPGTLNFEITETAVIRNVAEAGHLIAELQEMGCEFALDDFGSGLSSFGYLRRLPVGVLKIDGMFIRNIVTDETDRIFVKSIIDIAHTLNIKTVCELIENEDMLNVVRELGADFAQGFAIERPFELAPSFGPADFVNIAQLNKQKKAG